MAKYFYTIEQIDTLRRQVEALGLETCDGFWRLTHRQMQKFANGAGPERWSDIKRRALTSALSRYEAAFFIHDICYELGIGQKEADAMMLRNMKKIFRRDYGFFWWLKKLAWLERITVIPAVYLAVRFGGDDAYNEAQDGGGDG